MLVRERLQFESRSSCEIRGVSATKWGCFEALKQDISPPPSTPQSRSRMNLILILYLTSLSSGLQALIASSRWPVCSSAEHSAGLLPQPLQQPCLPAGCAPPRPGPAHPQLQVCSKCMLERLKTVGLLQVVRFALALAAAEGPIRGLGGPLSVPSKTPAAGGDFGPPLLAIITKYT
jgi:hypothetical protein